MVNGLQNSVHRLFITVHMGIKLFMVFFHNGWFFIPHGYLIFAPHRYSPLFSSIRQALKLTACYCREIAISPLIMVLHFVLIFIKLELSGSLWIHSDIF